MIRSFVAAHVLTFVGFAGGLTLGLILPGCGHPGGGGSLAGSAGTTGTGGNSSPTGTAGTGNGSAGTDGGSGVAGTTGTAGNVGITGTAGDFGTTGTGGVTSLTGTAGTGGTPGDAGTTGAAGSGAAGNGAAGTTGTGGTSGTAGATGTGGSGSGSNLIENGDFSGGAMNWHTEMGTGNVNGSGAYCVASPSGTTLVGYSAPAGTMLSLSGMYKLTFEASGAGTVHVKVGMAVSPYGADYEGNSSVTGTLQTFTHNFTASDNNAGVAFTFMNAGTSTVCLDNITLTSN